MEIIPSILTASTQELVQQLSSLDSLGLTVQIDFMDGQFVPSRSLTPAELPDALVAVPWEAHLMVTDPVTWSHALYEHRCRRVYWHVEVVLPGAIVPHHPTVEHALALRLETPVTALEPFAAMVGSVLLLSINEPGYQGEVFQESVYEKVKQIKASHPHLKVAVDGGVGLEHLKPLEKLGVDRVVVGSAFWKFGDPKTVLAAFRQATL